MILVVNNKMKRKVGPGQAAVCVPSIVSLGSKSYIFSSHDIGGLLIFSPCDSMGFM